MFYKKIKLLSIGDYITYLSDKKDVNFQMNIHRNNIVDIQLFHDDYNHDIIEFNHNEDEYLLAFYIKDKTVNKEEVLERVHNLTSLKDFKSLESELFGDCYFITLKKDWNNIFNHLKFIIEEIFCYNESDKYSVELIEIINNKPLHVNSVKIHLLNYLFK